MEQIRLQLTNAVGLHARPAAMLVKLANTFTSAIQIRNLTSGGSSANAKSILSLLTLGAERGHEVELTADGADEGEAVSALTALIRGNFTGGTAHDTGGTQPR